MLGKVKELCEDYITVRGDVPYCLEINYIVPDCLKPHMKKIMEEPELYLRDPPRLTKDYKKCSFSCFVIEKNQDGLFDLWKNDYVLMPTKKDQQWLKNNPLTDEFVDEDTIICNVVCNVCKNTLPPHSIKRHLNKDDKIHKCPHKKI